jgi:hypothetical protein
VLRAGGCPRVTGARGCLRTARTGTAAAGQADHDHAGHDEQDAGHRQRARALAEQHDARRRGEQRPGAPADRVHDRQVAQPVAVLQEKHVPDMQDRRPGQEHGRQAGQPGMADGDDDGGDRREPEGGDGAVEPDEAHGSGRRRLLAEQVPAGVRGGCHQDQGDGQGTHGAAPAGPGPCGHAGQSPRGFSPVRCWPPVSGRFLAPLGPGRAALIVVAGAGSTRNPRRSRMLPSGYARRPPAGRRPGWRR